MGSSSVARNAPASEHRISLPVDGAMAGACPGWYYDPADEAIYRWFDGERWTDHRSDVFTSESPDGAAGRVN